MSVEIENVIKKLFEENSVSRNRLDFVRSNSKNEITRDELIRNFKLYLDDMLTNGFNVMNEDLNNHFLVFLITSGYPIEIRN